MDIGNIMSSDTLTNLSMHGKKYLREPDLFSLWPLGMCCWPSQGILAAVFVASFVYHVHRVIFNSRKRDVSVSSLDPFLCPSHHETPGVEFTT